MTAIDSLNETENLEGFGTVPVGNRKARAGRTPRTGQRIKISATKAASFRQGQ
ncbi:MAG: hypothetical protein GTN74_10430 [Proteobacteria bacterium]|nr:hypothetical protein [Pseudomonadota bacterium]NIS70563.1 hypothetical protein [Pseudomonadota bacterium]